MDALGSFLVGLAVLAFLCVLYGLPIIVGRDRGVPNIGSIVIVNLLLGWTLIGWVVAMAMALRDPAPVARPYTPSVNATKPLQPAGPGGLAELERLTALREKGALTDAEFEAAKSHFFKPAG